MRLTLRTLLAYLDDSLEPAQAKVIGQKIAESEQARDLIARIQQVTRRRRITTPPDSGPGGKLDANTLGEYLDNVITPEQAAEVEEICLTSDPHLAEIAACHQILSLVIGEPTLVPPSAKQRMYGLVKGPEAIPFRKPAPAAKSAEPDVAEGREVDDTLRLGMAPVSGKNKGNPLVLVLAGVAAACLLVVAVWQILKEREQKTPGTGPNANVAQTSPHKAQSSPIDDQKTKNEETDQDPKAKTEDAKKENNDLPEVKLPVIAAPVAWAPPSAAVQPAGKLVADAKEPAILLQHSADKMEWQRIGAKNPEVSTGRPLVSLPASTSVIDLEKGLKLTLVGSLPQLHFPPPLLYESAVELHAHDQLDLDLTLRRGRIRILARDRSARVRVRFDNPTQPSQREFFDLALQTPGTEILIERWFWWPDDDKFFKDPKAADRKGPAADMTCLTLVGSVLFRHHDVSHALGAPPGNVFVYWSSIKGLAKPIQLNELPEGVKSYHALPAGADPRLRSEPLRARDELHQRLATKAVDVVFAECLKGPDPALRLLACCCLASLDDLPSLLEQLEQESDPDLRRTAIVVLRNWIACGRDNEYKVYDLVKAKYRPVEAETIMSLLHDLSAKDRINPDTWELLINYLDHPQLVVRELASFHLRMHVPSGAQKIRYSATADAGMRRQAQAAWRALIPPGQTPPMPMPMK
jgi:hypothetical protein